VGGAKAVLPQGLRKNLPHPPSLLQNEQKRVWRDPGLIKVWIWLCLSFVLPVPPIGYL
jgi:hypothetical protein